MTTNKYASEKEMLAIEMKNNQIAKLRAERDVIINNILERNNITFQQFEIASINEEKYLRSANGTCLKGYVEISYDDLVKSFGEPNADGDYYKVDVVWHIQTPFGIATIYNYKDGHNYLKEKGLDVEEITDWHIGGHNKKTFDYIQDLLKEKRL